MTQNIQQLREEFKQKIDILNNYLFAQDYKTQLLAQKSKLKELFDSALSKSFNA